MFILDMHQEQRLTVYAWQPREKCGSAASRGEPIFFASPEMAKSFFGTSCLIVKVIFL